MIKAFIFDMDGVIIDSEPIHTQLERKLFEDLGAVVSEEEHNSFIGTTSYYMWQKVKESNNLSETLEELVKKDRDTYLEYLLSKDNEEIKPIDGVVNLIEKLKEKGCKLAVASSSPMDVIEIVVKKLKIDKYFDVLVTGDMVEKSKPEPDIFLHASKLLKVSPKMCTVVEDSHNGVRAAKKAGMSCIGYENKNSGNQDLSLADIKVKSFFEVIKTY